MHCKKARQRTKKDSPLHKDLGLNKHDIHLMAQVDEVEEAKTTDEN